MLSSWAALLVASFGVTLAFAGCFADFGPSSNDGNAGNGATPSTGGSTMTSTGGAGGGTTTSTYTDPPTCSTAKQCDDENWCTADDCQGGKCSHVPTNEGQDVLDDEEDPHDCKKWVCESGAVVEKVDKSQFPDDDPNDCEVTYCLNTGELETGPDNEGELCGDQPEDDCKERRCKSGSCSIVNKPEGTVIEPGDTDVVEMEPEKTCVDKVCQDGNVVEKPNYENCHDPDEKNCSVPTCTAAGECLLTAGSMPAPAGHPCEKSNGMVGECDGEGTANGNCK